MTINAALTVLLHELAEEIPDALHAELPLYAIWHDLCRIAGEEPPRDVAACLDAPLDLLPVPVRRGSHAAHAAQFPELYAD